MIRQIAGVLDAATLASIYAELRGATWESGQESAGLQAKARKNNEQLPHDSPAMQTIRPWILAALDASTDFFSCTLPKRVFPPRVNRYGGSRNAFGAHVDNTIRFDPLTRQRLRTDISCTLFLNDPGEYDGGELVFTSGFGEMAVKLAAGDAVIYPSGTIHSVTPVTRGERLACFFWIESMVRDATQRELLFGLDQTIRTLRNAHGDDDAAIALTATYHNLVRMWADV